MEILNFLRWIRMGDEISKLVSFSNNSRSGVEVSLHFRVLERLEFAISVGHHFEWDSVGDI